MAFANVQTEQEIQMNVITIDFETYYDTEQSLKNLTTLQYVHRHDFKLWGVGINI